MEKLKWNVYIKDLNKQVIKKCNIFDFLGMNEIEKEFKQCNSKEDFSEKIRSLCMYHFWSRCEYEIVITSWPSYISKEEIVRLSQELKDEKEKRGQYPRHLCVNLDCEEKIDVYDQLQLNWDNFIEYLWNNLG